MPTWRQIGGRELLAGASGIITGTVNEEELHGTEVPAPVHQGEPNSPIHIKNSYASETPVTDGQRVYACFGNLGLYCFDLEGRRVWSRPSETRPMRNGWGTANPNCGPPP